jgi:hypothetical protein
MKIAHIQIMQNIKIRFLFLMNRMIYFWYLRVVVYLKQNYLDLTKLIIQYNI